MKNIVRLVFATFVFLLVGSEVSGQSIDFTLRYNKVAKEYEVYAKPDNSGLFFTGGGSQISVVLPASAPDFPLSVTPVNGGFWTDASRVYAPAADPAHDFHAISSGGASFFTTAGQEILIYKFKILGEECMQGVRLFENATDPDSSNPSMNGGDYLNYFANVFNPAVNEWRSNYDNAGLPCSDPPVILPTPIVVLKDSTTTVCMTIQDLEDNVSDSTAICGVTAGTATSEIIDGQVCVTYNASNVSQGSEEICLTVCDDAGICDTVIVPVTVVEPLTPSVVPGPPIVILPSITLPVDSTITVCTQILDPNVGDIFNVENMCSTPQGTVSTTISGSELCIEYDADGLTAGNDEVCIVVCDQTDMCDTIKIPVTIVPPIEEIENPQPPVVIVPTIVVTIDSTIETCLPIIDPNTQDTFNVSICGVPQDGTLNSATVDQNDDKACISYTAGISEGTDTLCLEICDDSGLCDTVIVTIITVTTIPIMPNPPLILPNPITVLEDSTTTVCMSVLDLDGNGAGTTSICGSTAGSATSAIVDGEVCVTFDASGVDEGSESVCLVVCDETNVCDTVQLPVTIIAPLPPSPIPQSPVVVEPVIVVPMDSTISVCTQILDPNVGDVFNVENMCSTPQGTVSTTISGSELCIEYDATGTAPGDDEVCIVICDQTDMCDTIKIPVTIVAPVEPIDSTQPPVVIVPPLVVMIDSTIDVCLPIFDPNPSDEFDWVICDLPNNGTIGNITVNQADDNFCFSYTAGNLEGPDSICLIICDDADLCDTVNIKITITNPEPANPPVILPNPITVLTGEMTTVCMAILDADGFENGTTSVCGVSDGSATSQIFDGELCVTYDASGVDEGTEEVCLIVCDQTGLCDTAYLPVMIIEPLPPSPGPEPPLVVQPVVIVPADSTITVCTQILDPNVGDVFNVENTCNTPQGIVTTTITGSELCIEYDANGLSDLDDEVCIVVCDQTDMCDTIRIPVTILPPVEPITTPQPPVVIVPPIVIPIDSTIEICMPIFDPNPTDTFTMNICALPVNGSLNNSTVDNANDKACLNYTAGTEEGTDSICVVICDHSGLCDTVTVMVTIVNPLPANPPVILPNPITVLENSTTTVCMPILDADGFEPGSTSICGVTAGSATSTIVDGDVCVTYNGFGVGAGSEEICLIVCDDTGLCDTVRVPVTVIEPLPPSVTPVPPVVIQPTITVPVDSTITVCTQIIDPNVGDIFNVENMCNTPLGTVSTTVVGSELCVEYDANGLTSGDDEICIVVCDQTDMCDTIKIPVTITPPVEPEHVTQPPIVITPPLVVNIDSTIEVCMPIIDPNPNDQFTVSLCGSPSVGSLNNVSVNNDEDKVCLSYSATGATAGTDSICLVVCDDSNLCDTIMVPITIVPKVLEKIKIKMRVFLSGAYDESENLMWDSIRMKGIIPLIQPYATYPDINYQGLEIADPLVFNVTGANAIVDWVIVELRDKNDPSIVVETRAGFVQRDGDVVDVDGFSPLAYNSYEADFYVSVRHRNHLGCMTETARPLDGNTPTIDFTTVLTSTYKLPDQRGSNFARDQVPGGVRVLWKGNYSEVNNTGDRVIFQGPNSDIDEVFFKVLLHPSNALLAPLFMVEDTYDRADGNMDGRLIYRGSGADTDETFLTVGLHFDNPSALPIYVIYEQIPK